MSKPASVPVEIANRPPRPVEAAEPVGELPVVARLVVEIRSDGTTTIARAGLSDELNRQGTVLEARGSTPLALALSLARHLVGLASPLLSPARPTPPVSRLSASGEHQGIRRVRP